MSLLQSVDFWVAVAFVLFIAIVWRAGAFGAIASAIDDRTARIRRELDEARKLRDEAEKVLAEYKRKRSEADLEAKAIVDAAKSEAQEIAAEAARRMEEFVARRTKLAETKIAQAEAQAVADVRTAAAETAVRAAERVLGETVKGKTAEDLISGAIKDVKGRLG
ncbi:MAG TPA: ATP F0F1 synthase subunit B [Xanthobacteraceae bacterium]|nr:ATP F0F1 synthase subunit B [Xanthobacteraceae bacterium]